MAQYGDANRYNEITGERDKEPFILQEHKLPQLHKN